jgi:hypothetical protein
MCEKAIQMLFVYSSHGLLANGNQSQDALDKDVCHVNTSPKLGDLNGFWDTLLMFCLNVILSYAFLPLFELPILVGHF